MAPVEIPGILCGLQVDDSGVANRKKERIGRHVRRALVKQGKTTPETHAVHLQQTARTHTSWGHGSEPRSVPLTTSTTPAQRHAQGGQGELTINNE